MLCIAHWHGDTPGKRGPVEIEEQRRKLDWSSYRTLRNRDVGVWWGGYWGTMIWETYFRKWGVYNEIFLGAGWAPCGCARAPISTVEKCFAWPRFPPSLSSFSPLFLFKIRTVQKCFGQPRWVLGHCLAPKNCSCTTCHWHVVVLVKYLQKVGPWNLKREKFGCKIGEINLPWWRWPCKPLVKNWKNGPKQSKVGRRLLSLQQINGLLKGFHMVTLL